MPLRLDAGDLHHRGGAHERARHPGHARCPHVHGRGRAWRRLRRCARFRRLHQTLRPGARPDPAPGSFHFFSVGLAIGAAALVAYYVQSFIVWPLAAFLSTTVYLLALGAESTAAYAWDHREKDLAGKPICTNTSISIASATGNRRRPGWDPGSTHAPARVAAHPAGRII